MRPCPRRDRLVASSDDAPDPSRTQTGVFPINGLQARFHLDWRKCFRGSTTRHPSCTPLPVARSTVAAPAGRRSSTSRSGRKYARRPMAGRNEHTWNTKRMLVASASRPSAAAPMPPSPVGVAVGGWGHDHRRMGRGRRSTCNDIRTPGPHHPLLERNLLVIAGVACGGCRVAGAGAAILPRSSNTAGMTPGRYAMLGRSASGQSHGNHTH